MKKIIIALAFVAALVFVGWYFFAGGAGDDDYGYRTAPVERSDIARIVIATGKIEPKSSIDIKSKIGGIVSRFYVEEGDQVKVGQILAEIIPGATPIELVAARNEVRTAALTKENAGRLYERAKELMDQNLISRQEYQDKLTRYETAKSRLYSAMAQLQVMERGSGVVRSSADIVLSAEDSIAIAREAREALNSMSLVSPINGIVLSRETDEGTTVTPISSAQGGTVIMVLADVSEVLFKGDVDEADIGKVHENTPVRIHVESYLEHAFEGILYRISPLGREENNIVNFKVEARVNDSDNLLRVGMSADAEIILAEHKDVLVVPEGTIYYDEEPPYVYVVDSLAAELKEKIPVTVGITDGIKTEVLSGLSEGELVIFKQ